MVTPLNQRFIDVLRYALNHLIAGQNRLEILDEREGREREREREREKERKKERMRERGGMRERESQLEPINPSVFF